MHPIISLYTDEIMLKGANRPFFERALLTDIRHRVMDTPCTVQRSAGKYIIAVAEHGTVDVGVIAKRMQKVPGVAVIKTGYAVPRELPHIIAAARHAIERMTGASGARGVSFKISAERSDKRFPLSSLDVARAVGASLQETIPGLIVDLKNPGITIWIEIDESEALVLAERYAGLGGMPSGTTGAVAALISGGLDSPVAACLMMRRGAEVIGVHCENSTKDTPGAREKIKALAVQLRTVQPSFTMQVIPFAELQRLVVMRVAGPLRMLVYKSLMLALADRVAYAATARAIVTGDSLAQVASQTLENISALYTYRPLPMGRGYPLPILSPLIGMNKSEIVAYAHRLGTYAISIMPFDDCCSMFVPKHPETRVTLPAFRAAVDAVMGEEEKIQEALAGIEII